MNQTVAIPDLCWMCGRDKLLSTLPVNWTGTCAQVVLTQETHIIQEDKFGVQGDRHPKNLGLKHQKRSGGSSFVEDPRVWIDAIGVPRGVPDVPQALLASLV